MIKILVSAMIIVVSAIQMFEAEIKIFVSVVESCFNLSYLNIYFNIRL